MVDGISMNIASSALDPVVGMRGTLVIAKIGNNMYAHNYRRFLEVISTSRFFITISSTVTSHVRHLPYDHGRSVTLSITSDQAKWLF